MGLGSLSRKYIYLKLLFKEVVLQDVGKFQKMAQKRGTMSVV
jgi:hypothetical protein